MFRSPSPGIPVFFYADVLRNLQSVEYRYRTDYQVCLFFVDRYRIELASNVEIQHNIALRSITVEPHCISGVPAEMGSPATPRITCERFDVTR